MPNTNKKITIDEVFDFSKFYKVYKFELYIKDTSKNKILCILLSDRKIKEKFEISREDDGKYSRETIFSAREFMNEEKTLTPNDIQKLGTYHLLINVSDVEFFFTSEDEGRHFNQIAQLAFSAIDQIKKINL